MTVDISGIKPGDEVTVRTVVTRAGKDSLKLAVPGIDDGVWFYAEAIASHVPKAIAPGERVVFVGIHGERNLRGEVLFVHKGAAWVEWEGSFPHDVVALKSLERTAPIGLSGQSEAMS